MTSYTYPRVYPSLSEEQLRSLKERYALLIDRHVAEKVLTPEMTMDVLEKAYKEEGAGSAVNRPKANILIPSENPERKWYRYCSMEGGIKGMKVAATRIKSDIVEDFELLGSTREDYYCILPGRYCGLILLFSSEDGALLAILNDGHVQHMRVAATVTIATKYMARKESSVLGVLGSGGMAWTHAIFLSRVFNFEKIKVYSPNQEHRKRFVTQLESAVNVKTLEVSEPREVFQGSDIVAACTNAHEPVVLGKYLEKGMHLTINKSRTEIDDEALAKLDRFVFYESPPGIDGTPSETRWTDTPNWGFSGGTRPSDMEKRRKLLSGRMGTLPNVLLGKTPGRANDSEITAFSNEGTGVQFAAVALKVYEEARAKDLGIKLPLEWFLEDIPN